MNGEATARRLNFGDFQAGPGPRGGFERRLTLAPRLPTLRRNGEERVPSEVEGSEKYVELDLRRRRAQIRARRALGVV